ncbi:MULTISPECIES: tryptophan-rich sensory protein [unclassified Knoellia]|uniref:tryptophan-rich sensory protein n=1 Tax=Knoellia altitudinis TaxID=3404795 RepID=UPI0036080FA2
MTSSDRTRQIAVTFAEIFCVFGTLVGVGVIGTRVAESAGGSLSADATLLAPAGPAFSIWSVVYVGLAAYTVWQWLPAAGRSELARRTGWLVAASMVLNAVWLLVTPQGWVWFSVLVIATLLLVLVRLALELAAMSERPADAVGTWITRATAGLYLGWVAVATFANIAAAVAGSGVDLTRGAGAVTAALVGVVVVAALVIGLMRAEPTRWGVAVAAVWGLGWLAIGRFTDEPQSTVVGVTALLAAAAIATAAVVFTLRARPGARSA